MAAGASEDCFAASAAPGIDPSSIDALREFVANQLGLPAAVVAAAIRRILSWELLPTQAIVSQGDRVARLLDASPLDLNWDVNSDKAMPIDFLQRSCVLVASGASALVRAEDVTFRCEAGCSFGGLTLYRLRSRESRIALIAAIPTAPLIRSLQVWRI
jgi:hypothetical protein